MCYAVVKGRHLPIMLWVCCAHSCLPASLYKDTVSVTSCTHLLMLSYWLCVCVRACVCVCVRVCTSACSQKFVLTVFCSLLRNGLCTPIWRSSALKGTLLLSLLLLLYSQSGHKQAPGQEVYRHIHLQSAEGCDFSASKGKHTWTGGTWRKASHTCNQNTTEIKTLKKIANGLGRYAQAYSFCSQALGCLILLTQPIYKRSGRKLLLC